MISLLIFSNTEPAQGANPPSIPINIDPGMWLFAKSIGFLQSIIIEFSASFLKSSFFSGVDPDLMMSSYDLLTDWFIFTFNGK